jgi:lactoylglutathione lyase
VTRIEHIGVWVLDIDAVAAFYARHFGARIGQRYENPCKGFASRFLDFGGGARLELMTRADVTERAPKEQLGLAHVAIALDGEAAVDALAAELRMAGVPIEDGPRRTGDGYYECVARDPEGNRVEITADRNAADAGIEKSR